jgi:hypothetical protein
MSVARSAFIVVAPFSDSFIWPSYDELSTPSLMFQPSARQHTNPFLVEGLLAYSAYRLPFKD